jgi:hypothetical protein
MGRRPSVVVLLAALAAVVAAASAAGANRDATSNRAAGLSYVAQVKLTGKAAKPRGEATGIGAVTICVDPAAGSISFGFEQLLLSTKPTAGHIHRGAAGANGPVVSPFDVPGPIDTLVGDVQWYGTGKATRATIEELIAGPAKHYVNVHTKKFPNGAVRGQLGAWQKVRAGDEKPSVCGVG